MPDYRQSLSFKDAYGRATSRSYIITAVDFIAGKVIAAANLVAVQNLCNGGVVKEEFTETTIIAGVPGAGSNVDVGATFQFLLGGTKQASINFPMIIASVVDPDATIDLLDPAVAAWLLQYTNGDILVSDGETVVSTKSGTLDK